MLPNTRAAARMAVRRLLPVTRAVVVGGLLAILPCPSPLSAADEVSVEVVRAQALALFPLRDPGVADGPIEDLGRQLFFDMRIGKDGKTGCVSCHLPEQWGADGRARSPDARGRLTERNSQTVFDVAALPALRWRGDRRSAAHQAEDSIKGSMGHAAIEDIVPVLQSLGYADAFARAFPGVPTAVTSANFGAALEAYQRTLHTTSAFDGFLAGDDHALDSGQLAGLQTFVRRGCAGCHNGPSLGGTTMQRFGLVKDYWLATGSQQIDEGRFAVTGDEADRYVFRVPVLRNIAKTGPYFHDGSVATLDRAVRVMAEVQFGATLPDAEVSAIVEFLESLTGAAPPHFAPIPVGRQPASGP